MFVSKSLVSKKGPLRAIWVAAYFYKKLSKAQIFETNVSSSVDKILHEQFDVLTYRVLAYLLLGIVRIYSKKVEYLLDDCQETLVQIKKFVIREQDKAKKKTPFASVLSITRPVSFDLDAFDLEILEATSGDNVVAREEITLKDVAWRNAGIGQYSLDRFAAVDDDFLMGFSPTEDFSCHFMNSESGSSKLHSECNLDTSMEKLRHNKNFQEEASHLKKDSWVEQEPQNLDEVSDRNDREHVEFPDMAVLENHMDQAAGREKYSDGFSSEECMNLCSEVEEKALGPLELLAEDRTNSEKMRGSDGFDSDTEAHQHMEVDPVSISDTRAEVLDIAGSEKDTEREASKEQCSENHVGRGASKGSQNDKLSQEQYAEVPEKSSGLQPFGEERTNIEKMKAPDMLQSEKDVRQVMEEDCNLEASLEELQAKGFSHIDLEESSPVVRPLGENIQKGAEQVNFPSVTTSEDRKCQVSARGHPLSVRLDATPQSKLRDASGTTTLHFMPIRTPATKERARFSRKRKCLLDDMIVFPNGTIRQWIDDASDLVSKRKKGDRAALAARKACWSFNPAKSFSEPSVPCNLDLKSLYCGKTLGPLESVKIMNPSEKIDMPEPPVGASSKQAETASETVEIRDPPDNPDQGASSKQAEIASETVEIEDPPDNPDLSESAIMDQSSLQAAIAPQTPVRDSPPIAGGGQTEIAPQTPVLCSISLRSYGSPENPKCDDWDDAGPAHSEGAVKEPSLMEIVEEEPSPRKDEFFDLDLEIHSNEDDNQGRDGWSIRTRVVAKCLQRSFQDKRKRGVEEKVNVSQLLEGRTKKASARLFYEILVLQTKGLLYAKQDTAFGDILVLKTPQWDQLYKTDGK